MVFLVSQTDIGAIRQNLASANKALIVTGYLLGFGFWVVSALRWRVFLEALEVSIGMAATLKLTLIGSFFNAFLPTGVGGDAYKAFRVRPSAGSLAVGIASVLLDRIAGIATLAIVGLPVAIAVSFGSDITPLVLTSFVVASGILVLSTCLLVLGENILGKGRHTWFGIRPRLRRAMEATAKAVRIPTTLRRSLGLGLVGQGFGISAYFALARSVGIDVSVGVIALGLLATTVAAAIPITVNGLGIREAVWVWSLTLYGAGRDEALAYALLVLGVSLATSAVGGVVYALAGGEVGPQEVGIARLTED